MAAARLEDFDQGTAEIAQLTHLVGKDVSRSRRNRVNHRADLTRVGRRVLLSGPIDGHPLDPGSERAQALVDLLVAPVDLPDVADL